jgi:hypothetical protein
MGSPKLSQSYLRSFRLKFKKFGLIVSLSNYRWVYPWYLHFWLVRFKFHYGRRDWPYVTILITPFFFFKIFTDWKELLINAQIFSFKTSSYLRRVVLLSFQAQIDFQSTLRSSLRKRCARFFYLLFYIFSKVWIICWQRYDVLSWLTWICFPKQVSLHRQTTSPQSVYFTWKSGIHQIIRLSIRWL